MTQTVLILGASGKIGRHAAEAFAKAGWTVRKFNRSTDDLMQSVMGADVIVNGFNPAGYKGWATLVPKYTADIIAAAKASGATVIIPGNVYNFGATAGTWGPTTSQAATTRKGRLRIEMEESYRQAAKDGLRTIILRGGDFLDPNRDGTLMSLVILGKIDKGVVTTMGPTDVEHAYCYLPDWARVAVALAETRATLNAFEDIPLPGESFTIQELCEEITAAAGQKIKITNFPWWLMRLASPVWTLAYELLEMRYLSEIPHRLSGARLAEILPDFHPTPRQEIMLCELPSNLKRAQLMAA
ncbi:MULTISPECIES: epimerase [Falsihalocynthiibacter]|uniref:epimerase n=1 Tax=Falsihalocynthiibacter TaxID=2854182 RepID=UPI0030028B9F